MHTQNTADQISKMRVKDEQEKKGLNKTNAMGLDRGTLWPARLSPTPLAIPLALIMRCICELR